MVKIFLSLKDAMLREFQDEIKRLKEQLASQGSDGSGCGTGEGKIVTEQRVVEKVVEVEKIVEVQGAATEEELAELKRDIEALKEEQRADIEKVVPECITTNAHVATQQVEPFPCAATRRGEIQLSNTKN